jgi:hypothetical protein
MRSIANFAPVLAALTFALTASADVPKIHQSSVSFTATGPAGLAIKGTGNKVSAEKAEGGKVLFRSSIWNMKTGMELRDGHLNDHLKADAKKTATLTISEKVVEECKKPGCSGKAKADFSMNGATKQVDVTYDSKKDDKGKLVVNGSFKIIISDYIKKPCYLGVCVNDEIKINVALYPKD